MKTQLPHNGCSIEDCTRHALWGGMCRDHLKELVDAGAKAGQETAAAIAKGGSRAKKKIDAVEVLTTDAVDDSEERTDDDE